MESSNGLREQDKGRERFAQDHEEEPKYMRLAWWDALIEVAVPILEDVPSAVTEAPASAGAGGLEVSTHIPRILLSRSRAPDEFVIPDSKTGSLAEHALLQ